MNMQGTLILALVFALFVALFSIQNAVPVSLTLFTWKFQTSLVVVVLGAIALGALIMGLFSSVKQFRLKRENRRLKDKNEELISINSELEQEIKEIKELKESKEISESNKFTDEDDTIGEEEIIENN